MKPGMKTRQTADLRMENTATILSLLLKNEHISRQQLIQHSGLAASTVSTITADLIDRGLIQRIGNIGSAGSGRKAEILARREDAAYAATVHFTPELLRIGIVNLGYKLVSEKDLRFDNGFDEQHQLQTVITELRQLISDSGLDGRISAAGLALPSDPFDNRRIVDGFSEAFEIPILSINNVEAMAICEYYFRLAPTLDTFIFVYIGTGIGSGFFVNGELYRGITGRASDFGHTYITDQEIRCRCGRSGCLEAVASERALFEELRNTHPELASLARQDLVPALCDLVRKEDAHAVRMLQRAADYLGKGIFNLTSILDPQSVVITGRINNMNPYFSTLVEQAYRRQARTTQFPGMPLQFIPLREDAGISGTAIFCFKTVFCGGADVAAGEKRLKPIRRA